MLTRRSQRQKRLYGLRERSFPPYLREQMEMDERYRADLAKDPKAAAWLSAFNEETLKGVRIRGECHVLSRQEYLAAHAARMRARRNRDALAFEADRGPLREASDGNTEGRVIEQIDSARSVRMRR